MKPRRSTAVRGSPARSRAMSLIEVMLALAILVVLSVGVTAFFFQVSSRQGRLIDIAARQRDASVVLGRLESAVMHAVAVGPDGAAGIKGDATSLTVITRGVWPMLAGDAAVGDACALTFFFDEPGQACTLVAQAVARTSGSSPQPEPVLGRVERVRLRYSDGRRWSDSFDSVSNGGLPVAVEVSIWFAAAGQGGAAEGQTERLGESPEELEPFGPDDVLDPGFAMEQDETGWVPREPDHVRIIGVPDAPEWKGRS
ncbi:MAG: type II secretion system protein GspJ, partial [Phycisphaerales bacterium JB041]